MQNDQDKNVRKLMLAAPAVFLCHWLEEWPSFVPWFNEHVARGITPETFRAVNLSALLITFALACINWISTSTWSVSLMLAWLSFLMAANALLHITAALVDQGYVPGLVTAALLYLPYYFWFVARIVGTRRLNPALAGSLVVIGAIPMLFHAYLILFRGERLF